MGFRKKHQRKLSFLFSFSCWAIDELVFHLELFVITFAGQVVHRSTGCLISATAERFVLLNRVITAWGAVIGSESRLLSVEAGVGLKQIADIFFDFLVTQSVGGHAETIGRYGSCFHHLFWGDESAWL